MIAPDLAPHRIRGLLRGVVDVDSLDDDTVAQRWALVAWNCLAEPGDSAAWRLIDALGAQDALREVQGGSRDGVAAAAAGLAPDEFGAGCRRWRPRIVDGLTHDALAIAARSRIRLLVPDDAEWPVRVDDLSVHAPLCLWVRGQTRALARAASAVALVGARAATGYGEHVAMELSAELASSGITIVSGAAYGIDGAAHRAALAAEGTTVALLAGGVERPYPAGHGPLIDRIAATGAVVSDLPCGSVPTKWRFLQRNRLIAALSDGTVVVEAGWRSGTLNTAGHAAALGRPLGAVPGPVTSAASAGCHRLLREYDAHCITGAADVRELLGLATSSTVREEGADRRPATDDRSRVRDALSTRVWRTVDDISRRAGMARSEVEAILGLLALGEDVERDARGWRAAASLTT